MCAKVENFTTRQPWRAAGAYCLITGIPICQRIVRFLFGPTVRNNCIKILGAPLLTISPHFNNGPDKLILLNEGGFVRQILPPRKGRLRIETFQSALSLLTFLRITCLQCANFTECYAPINVPENKLLSAMDRNRGRNAKRGVWNITYL